MLNRSGRIYLLKAFLFFAGYYFTGVLGLRINAINDFATLIWPPAGIALAAIFLLGYRFLPAITLAAFLVNFTVGADPQVAMGIGVGNTLEALAAVLLLKKAVGFKPDLERGKDVFGLVFFAAFLSTIIAATVGTTVLLAGNSLQLSQYRDTWVAWWVGDMLGVLLIAPLIFVWTKRSKIKYTNNQLMELAVVSTLLILVCAFSFRGYAWLGINEVFPRYYLVFPPLIWIALRFGRRGAVTASLGVAIIAIATTLYGLQNLSETEVGRNLIYVQGFIGVAAVTLLTVAAIVAERENTVATQRSLERRAKTLDSQRKNLMALSQSKDEFVAITSHQLRTPATAVKQYLRLLLEGYSDPLTRNQKNFLRKADENNTRQLQIIDELLLTTRLDLGKVSLNLEVQDPSRLIKQTITSLEGKFSERRQKVTYAHPKRAVKLHYDPRHLRSVIENLLENASNYSGHDTTIKVRLKKLNSGAAEIIIEDEGVGINPADYPKLFQKFSRIPNELSNTVNGTGLGLYFSKKIIDLHNGKIRVEPSPKQGSRFTIFLPS